MLRPQGLREWTMIALIGLTVAVAIILPVYVVREINGETELILDRIERQVNEDRETNIRVNVATIACLGTLDPITAADLRVCIDNALEIAEQ